MKKVLWFVFVFAFITAVNIIVYKHYEDYNTFDFGPSIPSNRSSLIVATYLNSEGKELVLQKYYWMEKYKFIYYQPINLSTDFVINVPEELLRFKKVYANYLDSLYYLGDEEDFLNLDYCPNEIILFDSSRKEIFTLDRDCQFSVKDMKVTFIDKLTLGPITELW